MPLGFEHAALTDVGRMRDNNEDTFGVVPERELYVVADGMGGHASGQVASRVAVENIRRYVVELYRKAAQDYAYPVPPGATEPERLLSWAIQWANERVFIESLKDRQFEGMGTTVVAVMGVGRHVVLGHVGDSRIYRLRGGQYEQVTRDHSLLNHYIDKGKITTEEEAKNFKETNVIVRAVGLKDYVEPTVQMIERRPGDLFLLCSDGLCDQVDDAQVAAVLNRTPDLHKACKILIDMANLAGGKDNCTVMLLRVTDNDEDEDIPKTIRREIPVEPREDDTRPSMPAIRPEDFDREVGDTDPDLPMPEDPEERTDPNFQAPPLPPEDAA